MDPLWTPSMDPFYGPSTDPLWDPSTGSSVEQTAQKGVIHAGACFTQTCDSCQEYVRGLVADGVITLARVFLFH